MNEQMCKLKNYYKELPAGFCEDYVIDAKKKSTSRILTLTSLLITVVVAGICIPLKFLGNFGYFKQDEFSGMSLPFLVFALSLIAYIVLHELTHGLFYKLFTMQKLTFGLTLSVAYCGLKEGYVNKMTAAVAILAPFALHSIWMIVLVCVLKDGWALAVIMLFALHFGGCAGDLYGTFILLFKYRGKAVLMNDTGPRQTFYIYKPYSEQSETIDEKKEEA